MVCFVHVSANRKKKTNTFTEITRQNTKWEETQITNENWKQENLRTYLELADYREIEEMGKNEASFPTARSSGESFGDRIGDSEYLKI